MRKQSIASMRFIVRQILDAVPKHLEFERARWDASKTKKRNFIDPSTKKVHPELMP